MVDEVTRRRLLYGGWVAGAVGVAGCSDILETGTSPGDETGDSTPSGESSGEDTSSGVDLIETSLETTELTEGEAVVVTVDVVNARDATTEFDIRLRVGNREAGIETISLEGGEEASIEFKESIETTGTQAVNVNEEAVGTVVVRAKRPDIVRDVAANYYPWYGAPGHSWRGGEWSLESPSTPVLGNYNSTNPEVIEQHIDWCRRAGISWLNVSWWGPESYQDTRFQGDILDHPRADELEWSVLYETTGRLEDGKTDMDIEWNQERFQDDLKYLAENYFHREHYKHIDGRPVLYVWVANLLRGDVAGAYNAAVEAAGVEPYLIVDLPETVALDSFPVIEVADAVTTYNPYTSRDDIEEVFLDRMESAYRGWYLAGQYVDVDVMPTAIPGFDDTEITHVERDNPPLETSPERYENAAGVARQYGDGPVFVTSFNEWYEDTQIEPSEEHGEKYLEITADVLASGGRSPPQFTGDTFALEFEETVPESELNPDVENGRDLSMNVNRLIIRDEDEEPVVDIDVGGPEDKVTFLLGVYVKERGGSDTSRWFGESGTIILHVPMLPAQGSLELVGRGATAMGVRMRTEDDIRGEGTIDEKHGSYAIEYR